MNSRKTLAFSLIELSIVILIVRILIAGVVSASRVVLDSRLKNAKTMTQSSPVASIQGLYAWFDTVSSDSFRRDDLEDQDAVANWYDINPQNTIKMVLSQSTSSSQPKYEYQGLNDLPVLYFDGGDSMSSAVDVEMTGNPSFTFIVVAKIEGGDYGPFINFGTAGICQWLAFAKDNQSNNGAVFTGFYGGGHHYEHASLGTSRSQFAIHSWVRDSNDRTNNNQTGNQAYVNGVSQTLVNEGTTCVPNIGRSELRVADDSIGNVLTGRIAEIIMFSRALRNNERQAVERYLSKKWAINVPLS